jgi:hypothetical protein
LPLVVAEEEPQQVMEVLEVLAAAVAMRPAPAVAAQQDKVIMAAMAEPLARNLLRVVVVAPAQREQ